MIILPGSIPSIRLGRAGLYNNIYKSRKIMKQQLQHLQFRTLARNTLLLFVVIGFFCSLFPSGNALAEIQQQNPDQHILLPSQNYHLIFIVVEKTKRQESIPSGNSSLFNALSIHHRQVRFAAQTYYYAAIEILPLFISNLLYTQTTSSCL
jgi:hypothetical protein